MLSNLKSAFLAGLHHWKIALLVYFLQLLLAVPLAMQVWHVLEASIGNSLEISKLLYNYDHTVISDFLKVHGGSITPLVGQLRWVLLVWVLASVFINGGILVGLVRKTPTGAAFWSGGAAYFFRFAKIGAIFLLLTLLWTGITILPYLGKLMYFFETMPTEKTVLGYLVLIVAGWLLGLIFFNNASVAARTAIIENGLGTWPALKKGVASTFRHFFKITAIFLVFSALQMVAVALYWWLESRSGMVTAALVVVFFVVQQALVLVRILGRVMVLAAISSFHTTGTTVNPSNNAAHT